MKQSFHILLCLIALASLYFVNADEPDLYPGISAKQNSIATTALQSVNNLDWDDADSKLQNMTALEESDSLPPLSFLLRVAMRVTRLQNDEFEDNKTKDRLAGDIVSLVKTGILRSDPSLFPDSVRPTLQFISGGIRGFAATLDIESSPMHALNQGLDAVRSLDTARTQCVQMTDAYLGSGLFNCLLAKYPGFYRFVIALFKSKSVSNDTGIVHLRICAKDAMYTKSVAQQYLLQYLSPYIDAQAAEKRRWFKTLEAKNPANGAILFLDIDEAMTFYPDSVFNASSRNVLKRKLSALATNNYSQKRYADLVKRQLSAIDSTYSADEDSLVSTMPFSFYPVFCDGVKLHYTLLHDSTLSRDSKKQIRREIETIRDKALRLLKNSTMNSLHKPYFKWHINEALDLP